jgi:aspartate carbamoyltransferase catalytic subunit
MNHDRHLLDLDDAARPLIEAFVSRAQAFRAGVLDAAVRLRGKSIVGMFFEPSTRTALSFAVAAARLGASWVPFEPESSSLVKGESLEDTMRTIQAIGVDAIVVRHRESGFPHALAEHFSGSIVNAGDGWHAHPTQGLADAMTLLDEFGSLDGRRLLICGDVRHSRVARSTARAAWLLGARVTLCGPPLLLPPTSPGWGFAEISADFDRHLPLADAVVMLRMQKERGDGTELPPPSDLVAEYGLTERRAGLLAAHAVVMHPGPVNRDVEMASSLVAGERSRIERQVENGVYVRMAVLERLLRAKDAPDRLGRPARPAGARA